MPYCTSTHLKLNPSPVPVKITIIQPFLLIYFIAPSNQGNTPETGLKLKGYIKCGSAEDFTAYS